MLGLWHEQRLEGQYADLLVCCHNAEAQRDALQARLQALSCTLVPKNCRRPVRIYVHVLRDFYRLLSYRDLGHEARHVRDVRA